MSGNAVSTFTRTKFFNSRFCRAFRRVDPSTPVKTHDFLKELTGYNYFGYALEPIPFARKRINDVYFDGRVLLDVRDRSRRANIGEDEVTVVPNLRWCPSVKDWASHQGKQSPQRLGAAPRQHASYLQ